MTRILRSFRWQLQAWHSVLLLAVLVPFCASALFLQHQMTVRRIDAGLRHHLEQVLENQRRVDHPPAGERRRPRQEQVAASARVGRELAASNIDPDEGEEEFDNRYYHIVWTGDRVVAQSPHAPAELLGETPPPPGNREIFRRRPPYRELIVAGPHASRILVGREVAAEMNHAWHHALWLIGAGIGVLLLGVSGGWWLATRALRPIVAISATAEKIAAGNLQERIDASRFATEFAPLAQTLNHSFERLHSVLLRQAQFTADASHELRTPVSVTLLTTQSALSRERSVTEYREALQTCERAAQRMRQLVESLLLLARLDARDEHAPRAPVELPTVIARAVDLLQPLATQHRVIIETSLAALQTEADAEQLVRVITNLVSNAIYHSPAGGTVRIELTAQPGSVVLTVADHGEGIAPADLPHIFDRFYRADTARRRTDGRTGLGLAITKAIVESHGGRIEVTSEPGHGSTFMVFLPASVSGRAS